ncbi:hypothetical protein KKI24_11665 [bacterium]|nr:hypothetical protein [bacterium]
MDRDDLINQIQDHDVLIQSYVEEDNPKSHEELKQLSDSDLREWLEIRQAVLKFLIDTEDDSPINFPN